jgi:hypothetical protein
MPAARVLQTLQTIVMRFTIAAALLTQAIPATSSSSPLNNDVGGALLKNNKTRRLTQAAIKERLGKVPAIKRSLRHENSSIQNSNLCVNKPQMGGASRLKNSKRVECDPSSQDELDIGILSCGSAGHQHSCKESEESSLGGFCIVEAEGALSVSRALQIDPTSFLCDPNDEDYIEGFNCDCDGVDSDTFTGTITCIPYDRCCVDAGDSSFCVPVTIDVTFDEGLQTEILDCYAFTSPYEKSGCYSTIYDDDGGGTCVQTVNNEECSSCELVNFQNPFNPPCHSFDCTNTDVDEAQVGSTCEGVHPLPIVELFNSVDFDEFPPVCGIDPATDPSTDSSADSSKSLKKGKKGKKSSQSRSMTHAQAFLRHELVNMLENKTTRMHCEEKG